jgi:hypothetical protein
MNEDQETCVEVLDSIFKVAYFAETFDTPFAVARFYFADGKLRVDVNVPGVENAQFSAHASELDWPGMFAELIMYGNFKDEDMDALTDVFSLVKRQGEDIIYTADRFRLAANGDPIAFTVGLTPSDSGDPSVRAIPLYELDWAAVISEMERAVS